MGRADSPAFIAYDANVDGQNFGAGNTKTRLKTWGDDFRTDVQVEITDHEIAHLDGWASEAPAGTMKDRAVWLSARLTEFRPDIVVYVASVKGDYDAAIDVLDKDAPGAKDECKGPITDSHFYSLHIDWPRLRSARLQVWELSNPGDPDIPTSQWWEANYDTLDDGGIYSPHELTDFLDG